MGIKESLLLLLQQKGSYLYYYLSARLGLGLSKLLEYCRERDLLILNLLFQYSKTVFKPEAQMDCIINMNINKSFGTLN